ncbi:ABC transporter substrate-binding protein [Rhodoblastus acidophilus]|uniref:ABC transporter substrate-binding protein n=1 Tax=Candidatus Rhodoblastus alkanivorans TaxID=2954117 RepID=A0ABS9Z6L6_9HYPH|nr:ABC transporter substrate-binding protein [Candidatus Rhodoblastus alkanivorans]MCI4680196.1 ABC transporter substrate-binding protein [Candidatus Rhodoblastus alkanivorans]MCI4682282.1 ABC transporter substrate-binding protein [Candidatus Rhodoblastus alkanivorans]MDI4639584.1 ABC transporter substrate-binding protein [Rhodoblastus acidophilus]
MQEYAALRRRTFAWTALRLFYLCVCLCVSQPSGARAQGKLQVNIGYIAYAKPAPALYDLYAVPKDEGERGAALAIAENNTTGSFVGQTYELTTTVVEPGQSPVAAARALADKGVRLFIADLPTPDLIQVADALRPLGALVFNAAAQDNSLRGADCRPNLFHLAPSRAMLTDALAQFLVVRQWRRILLVIGPRPHDAEYAASFWNSAKKFGLKIVAQKPWTFGPLAKARSDSVTEAAALTFARGIDYDVIVVADEANDFGDYILYRTAEPKLVLGTQGLVATSWSPVHIAWGAEQLQTKFLRFAGRHMRPIDYQAWMAGRAIGDAAVALKKADASAIRAYLVGPDFSIGVYKGVAATFRPWDLQLRQPVLLAQPMSIVGIAPQPGFLHQRTTLDTLGFDLPETACHFK